MKTISPWKNTLTVIALLTVLFPMLGEAGPMGKAGPLVGQVVGKNCLSVKNRPLSDFLNAQGTLNNPPQFFPDVKDYVGWADAVDPDTGLPTTFALVDYAGLANEHIKAQTGHSLGTKVEGLVVECGLADGKAQITVTLFTIKALGFSQSIAVLANNGFNFLITPTIFGAKAQDVVNGVDAAVGPVTLLTTFSSSAPGAALPDFLDVVNNPNSYAPAKLSFMSATFGKCSNGIKARLEVHQEASTKEVTSPPDPPTWVWVYSKEIVKLVPAQGGKCIE